MNKRVRPEVIVPRQEKVSKLIETVHEHATSGRPIVASIALDSLIQAGNKIDYAAVGEADNSAYNQAAAASSDTDELYDEQARLRDWVTQQHGAAASDALIKNIRTELRHIDRIGSKDIPKAEQKLTSAQLAADEMEGLADVTGEAWPYYPALAHQAMRAFTKEHSLAPSDVQIRRSIHNIIARLSADARLGVTYATFTTHLFSHADGDEKGRIAKALPAMQADGEIVIWQEGPTRYIRSAESSYVQSPTEAKRSIALEVDLSDETTELLIRDIHAQLGIDGYRRINNEQSVELQVPLKFVQDFASRHNMTLARRGPAMFQLLK